VLGTCLSFDGTDDYVRVADTAELRITGDIPVSAWIKPTGARSVESIVSKRYEFELGPAHSAGRRLQLLRRLLTYERTTAGESASSR
jgi:hypothetical protein